MEKATKSGNGLQKARRKQVEKERDGELKVINNLKLTDSRKMKYASVADAINVTDCNENDFTRHAQRSVVSMTLRCQIFLFANFTDQYYPFFEISYIVEAILSLFLLGVIPLLIRGVWSSKGHRNIRIIISHIWFRYGSGIISRLILLYYQAFSIPWTDSDLLFAVANFNKSSFIGYLVSLMSCIAFERLVATFMWCWYEQQSVGTIAVAVMSLLIPESLGVMNSYLYSNEIISIQNQYMLVSSLTSGSALCVAFVYMLNIRIMKDLKTGARINSYSINRTYQIRENLKVFAGLLRFAGPTLVFNLPAFAGYALFLYLPESLNTIRYFAVEFYDFYFSIYGLSYLLVMMHLRNKSKMRAARLTNESAVVESVRHEGDIYFSQLNAQFKRQ